jgi:hypothetical protein
MSETYVAHHSSISEKDEFWSLHRCLAQYNRVRLTPGFPSQNWRELIQHQNMMSALENQILEIERSLIQEQAVSVPRTSKDFIDWFEALRNNGPGQSSTLFDWLAESATWEQMKWFLQQEVAGEAGFEDLTAMTQVKIPLPAKLEMARNYWDEMGRGRESGMHGPMLAEVAKEFEVDELAFDEVVPQALALNNVMLGLAMNRQYAYHSIGALGAIELTAPARAQRVHEGLRRLGVSRAGQQYYYLHSVLDLKHSEEWNHEVLGPLIEMYPQTASAIAEGALMRLHAGARCFERYERYFKERTVDHQDGETRPWKYLLPADQGHISS